MLATTLPRPALVRAAALLVLTLALVFGPTACNKVPLLAPSGSVINLFPTANVVPLNGSVDLIATVIENGTAQTGTGTTGTTGTSGGSTTAAGTPVQNGTVISFTTTLGTISPTQASTTNGQATVTLNGGGIAGTAVVTAYSGGASRQINVQVGASTTITLTPPTTAITVSTPATFTVAGTATGSSTSTTMNSVVVDFGDGSQASLGAISASTPVTHLFAAAGTYTVSVSAVDSQGNPRSTSTQVAVAPFTASVAASPTSVTLTSGAPIAFSVTLSPTTVSIDHISWDFGDGSTAVGNQVNHVYGHTGAFTVTATIVPVKGNAVIAQTQVAVN